MTDHQSKVDLHTKVIQEEFSRQAEYFGKEGYTLSSKEYLSWATQNMHLQYQDEVLDVAAGTGHLSRAIAPYVKKVTAVDVTEAMLQAGMKEAQKEGISNISFELGIAESLPYEDSTFTKVASRLVFHHFVNALPPFQEMLRVCRPGGKIIAIDLVSPADQALSKRYNYLERLRDPSHTTALTLSELTQLMSHPGLELETLDAREIKVDLESWMELTQPPSDLKEKITQDIKAELSGGEPTGMRPFEEEGKLKFLQTWVLVVSRKL